jgi:hypothetical protein
VEEVQMAVIEGGQSAHHHPPTELISILEWKRLAVNPEVVIVRGEDCTGFGWHHNTNRSVEDVPIYLVVKNYILLPHHHEPMSKVFTEFRERFKAMGGRDTGWDQAFKIKHTAMKMLGVQNPQH